jgi:hypothetical protein
MTALHRIAAGFAATAAAAALTAAPTPAVADDDDRDAGGTTTVVLNQPLVPALVGLGVAPVAPGTLTAPGQVVQAAFPITEIDDGVVEHSGGLAFTKAAAGRVKITKFEVDVAAGKLTAKTTLDGRRLGRVAVFDLVAPRAIDAAGTIPACDGVAAGLTLTAAAAGALGVPAGTFIGDACVVPQLQDDDDDRDDDGDDREDDD